MTESHAERRRIDSWKAIASYLSRDERTVRRWERELGLPVRRLPGGRGRSVHAYADELDAWLQRGTTAPAAAVDAQPTRRPLLWGAAAVLVGGLAVAMWMLAPRTSPDPLTIRTTPDGVRAYTADGAVAWTRPFSGDFTWALPSLDMAEPSRAVGGAHPAVYVAVGLKVRRADERVESGVLYEFTPRADSVRAFAFSDTVTIGGTRYSPPWVITSFSVSDSAGARRIVVSAHHQLWGASVVALLDERFQRRGTLVHDGWIEGVRWLGPDRILATGFSNPDDAGTALLLSADSIAAPLRVLLFARSDLNRATHSPFNRAVPQLVDHRIIVRTLEMQGQGPRGEADILYEFTPTLELISARYSDRYREAMREIGREVGSAGPPGPRVQSPAAGRTILTAP